ncbi:hypothetical protein M426DRAFT_322781 [Hypoxylon sp. CI-4A]|nr:hypothetical protein M426DRAFT_322781 [Hypoxylon sp. CI-4A]
MSEPATSAVQPDIIMTNDKGDSSPLSEPSPPSSPIEKQSRSRGRSGPRGRRHKAKSSTGGQLPTIWEPGLKEIKVTEDMTFAERKHADEWNTAFARVKADHTREQNRKSAQKSRQKKVELLDRTREERDRFQQKNMHMNHQLGVLEERVSKLASENQHLRSQHENSRNRIILLEAQLQQQVQLGRKMSQALPQMGAQAQTQAQVQAQAQPQLGQNNMASRSRTPSQPQGQGAPRQSQSQAQPQGGSGSGYMLGGTNTTQFLGGNMATPGPSTSQQQQQQPQQQPTPISPDEDHINWFSLTNLCDMGSGNQS